MEGIRWTRDRHRERINIGHWLNVKWMKEEEGSECTQYVKCEGFEGRGCHQPMSPKQKGSNYVDIAQIGTE